MSLIKKIAFPAVLIIIWVVTWNYSFITSGTGNYHTDERDTIAVIDNLIQNNDLLVKKSSNLNQFLGYELFAYGNTCSSSDCRAKMLLKPYGEYYILAYFKAFFGEGYYMLIAILNLISFLFLYLFLRKILQLKKTISRYILSLLFIFPIIIYWNNFQYTNSVAFTFFIGGLFLLLRSIENKRDLYKILGGILISIAIFTRYEYLVILTIVFLSSPLFILRNFKLTLAPLIITIATIGFLNTRYFGGPLKLSYTEQYSTINTSNVIEVEKSNKILTQIKGLYNRFFASDIHLNVDRLVHNYLENIDSYLNIFIIFFLLGFIHFLLKGKYNQTKKLLLFFMLGFIYWGYNTLAGYHWGQEHLLNFTVHSRYIYGLYFFLIIFSIYFLSRLHLPKYVLIVVFFAFLVSSMNYCFNGKGSIEWFSEEKRFAYKLNNKVSGKDVFIGNVYEKYINNGYVIPYSNIETYGVEKVTSDLEDLYEKGYIGKVIISEYDKHKTYLNYASKFKGQNYYVLTRGKF